MSKTEINRIVNHLNNLAARGRVSLVNDDADMQILQVKSLNRETLDDIERFQNYGFTSKPFEGAEHITLFPTGSRTHGITLVVADRRYRMKGLANGEVAIYDDQNQSVHIRRDGIWISSAQQVVVDTPQALFTGDVGIDGELYVVENISSDAQVSDVNGSMQEMRDTFNSHSHNITGGSSAPGPTAAPNQSMS